MFGASGDLSARKLLPGALQPLARGAAAQARRHRRRGAGGHGRRRFRRLRARRVRKYSRTKPTREALDAFTSRLRFVRARPQGQAARPPRCAGARTAPRVPGGAALRVRLADHRARQGRPGRGHLPDHRETVRTRPQVRPRAQRHIHTVLPEERVFRIDHYLGKETVQNLLVFRFGNSIFERIWNRDAVAASRSPSPSAWGSSIAAPSTNRPAPSATSCRTTCSRCSQSWRWSRPSPSTPSRSATRRSRCLRALKPLKPGDGGAWPVHGGHASTAQRVPGYRSEPGVARNSTTETFAAMGLCIDSWRWSGVPFFVRTGKRLADARHAHRHHLPRRAAAPVRGTPGCNTLDSNRLVVHIQPDEGISVTFVAKVPGPEVRIQPVNMNFSYESSFKTSPPEAYERLLHDALEGDHTLFIREDEVERGWLVVQPVLDAPPPIVDLPRRFLGAQGGGRPRRAAAAGTTPTRRRRMSTLVGRRPRRHQHPRGCGHGHAHPRHACARADAR